MGNRATELEIIMREALLENGFFFDEQVYIRKEQKHFEFDFVVYGVYCRVLVECDGPHHYQQEQWYKDSLRDLWTVTHGYQDVLRFNRYQLRTDINTCMREISQTITMLDKALSLDQKRKELVDQEKDKIINRKNSPFYIGEREKNLFTNKRVEIPKISSAEIRQKEKFQMMERNPFFYWFQERLRAESRIRELNPLPVKKNEVEPYKTEQHLERKKLEIPEEQMMYERLMKTLTTDEMNLLLTMIKGTNKDGFYVFQGSIESIQKLCSKGLLEINPFYRSIKREISVRVLPNAPLLLKQYIDENKSNKYQQEIISKGTDSIYQKCSVNGCIAKIPTQMVVEWNGRCPRHQ
ncbi:endonuclease domain-containing protein [Bacillus sp. UNC438CL73TsuS30]|uniref:endonuclease domain-containing protein n=1 Tax=Bacillus sp. UNC438CL73TsuS30 TaxID=1340434 RepID=UPI00047B436A|nr:DUF559 domain-containing protein [Bacillus sp. UNC438CL73TsuS30]